MIVGIAVGFVLGALFIDWLYSNGPGNGGPRWS